MRIQTQGKNGEWETLSETDSIHVFVNDETGASIIETGAVDTYRIMLSGRELGQINEAVRSTIKARRAQRGKE